MIEADINVGDNGLKTAIRANDIGMIQLLLDINDEDDFKNKALDIAADEGNLLVTKFLISLGAKTSLDSYHIDSDEVHEFLLSVDQRYLDATLWYASQYPNTELIKSLIERGAVASISVALWVASDKELLKYVLERSPHITPESIINDYKLLLNKDEQELSSYELIVLLNSKYEEYY